MSAKWTCKTLVNASSDRRSGAKAIQHFNYSHISCFEPTIPVPELTERQKGIREGTIENPRKVCIVRLIKKLEYYERFDDAAKVYDNYGYMFHEVHEDDPSPEEAVNNLVGLTPDDLK